MRGSLSFGVSRYVLDTNVFIEAYRRYYAFDIAYPFWEALIELAESGIVLSVDKVLEELKKEDDRLKNWAEKQFGEHFASTDNLDVVRSYQIVINWANSQKQFLDKAKQEFMKSDNADAWIVSYAHAYGFVVITHEAHSPNIKKRIPIPNVCKALGVEYINTFEFLKRVKFEFTGYILR